MELGKVYSILKLVCQINNYKKHRFALKLYHPPKRVEIVLSNYKLSMSKKKYQ